MHVSLSRVVPIRYSQIDPLQDLLREVLRDYDRWGYTDLVPDFLILLYASAPFTGGNINIYGSSSMLWVAAVGAVCTVWA